MGSRCRSCPICACLFLHSESPSFAPELKILECHAAHISTGTDFSKCHAAHKPNLEPHTVRTTHIYRNRLLKSSSSGGFRWPGSCEAHSYDSYAVRTTHCLPYAIASAASVVRACIASLTTPGNVSLQGNSEPCLKDHRV